MISRTHQLCFISPLHLAPEHTKSARESSSWPMSDDLFLHRATLPSKKSKKRPNGINANAAHIFAVFEGAPRQYRMEENIDIIPQKPDA